MITTFRLAVLGAALLLGGCSSSSNAAGPAPADGGVGDMDASGDDGDDASVADASDDAFHPAAHTPLPQVPNQGGPRLLHPHVVTVTFANDTRAPTFESFAQWIFTSSWLTAAGAEYGIGPGAVTGVAHRPETPPTTMTSADIEMYLAQGVMDGSIPKPASPSSLADALYIVYFPTTTSITATFVNGITKQSCRDFGAYHSEVHKLGLDFAYAAIPTCGGAAIGLTAMETIEMVVAHEFIEAATDAFPITMPAWQLRADPEAPWFNAYQFEVEVGDMCELPSRFFRDGAFVAQRSWSNAAAAAGNDPCVPADPKIPYFNTSGTPTTVQHIAPGASADFDLRGWSPQAGPDWTISTRVIANIGSPFATLNATAMLDTTTMNNGGTAKLHVTAPADATAGTSAVIEIVSQRTLLDYNVWFLGVATP